MTKLLEEALARVQELPEEEQDRAAEVLLALVQRERRYTLTADQIEGVRMAVESADRSEFASTEEINSVFGRAP